MHCLFSHSSPSALGPTVTTPQRHATEWVRSRRRTSAIVALLCLSLAPPIAFGQVEQRPSPDAPIQTLLLNNGELMEGRVLSDAENFSVFPAEGGRITLPRNQVARLCGDVQDAYRYRASQVPAVDTVAREKLVEWCMRQDLLTEAQFELQQLAQWSNRKEDVAALQRRLAMKLETKQLPPAKIQPASYHQSTREQSRPSQITPEALAIFSRKIQPLLSNGCATANCHGRATATDFKIGQPPRGFSFTQRLTQRNLAAVLRQLNMVAPGDSPLLRMARTPHGNAKAVYGAHQTKAVGQITRWIGMVAGPIAPPTLPPVTKVASSPVHPATPSTMMLGGVTPRIIIQEEPEMELTIGAQDVPTEKLDAKEKTPQGKDPFDADVFNATFGG